MARWLLLLWLAGAWCVWGAAACPPTPVYSPCELTFEMSAAEAAQNPNPYLSVTLHAEFRSPRHRTVMMPGYWDGGRKFVIRFTPRKAGDWEYRVTSSAASINGQSGTLTATAAEHPGFIQPDNLRAWSTTETRKGHLWMGDTAYTFTWLSQPVFDQLIEARARQHFNHIRGLVMSDRADLRPAYTAPDQPDPEHFQQLDQRIRAMNEKGIFADLILAASPRHLRRVFPEPAQRARYVRYLIARYSPFMITWQGVGEFEQDLGGRALLKELGLLLKQHDPFGQPRSTGTLATSGPLWPDGWMTHIVYRTSSVPLAAVERQVFQAPMVNTGFGAEDSGAGRASPNDVASDEFRHRLWRLTMNGQYPTFQNTGSDGANGRAVDAKYFDSAGATAMKAWYELFAGTRFWELEPFFEVEGGVALALGGIEYIVYLEKPGPVSVVTEKKSYEVYWYRPATGEVIKEKKDFKGEKFEGQPPDGQSDWVLHLSRDGRKESMARSWKFESRPILVQEPERDPRKTPFEMAAPVADTLPVGKPARYEARLTRQTRASKMMLYLWQAEATAGGEGYRVIGDAATGDFTLPASLSANYPAVVNLRLYGLNGNGKLYQLDRVLKAER